MSSDRIARAVYPEEFASQVEAEIAKVNQRIGEQTEPEQPEIDHADVMPGQDPFEMLDNGEDIPQQGIFVDANLWKGSHGIFEVYRYNSLAYKLRDYRPRTDEEILHIEFDKDGVSRELQFAYERAGYVGREKPPYDRGDPTTYMGYSWDSLDIVNLPSKGRLLIMKEPASGYSAEFCKHLSDLLSDSPRREVSSYFDPVDADGVISCIEAVATKLIGLSPEDARIMGEAVKTRLFPSNPELSQ